MASTIKQRLRRFNGTDYDTVHLETEAKAVLVPAAFTNPLNTDQLTAGQHNVYFTAYPDIMWHVDHVDGDYVYLGLYNCAETTAFGSNTAYSGSTIAAKCTTFLNNTIPNVADYLESVTVENVTNKVFVPTYYQMSGQTGYGDTSGPIFTYLSGSSTNRVNMINNNWNSIGYAIWLSTALDSSSVWFVHGSGNFYNDDENPLNSLGFRPEVKVRYKDSSPEPDTLDNVLDDLKTSVSSGKASVAQAVTDKGVTTASDASFSTIATNIGSINTRTDGTLDSNAKLLSGYTAYGSGGTKYTGSISSKTAQTYTPTTTAQTITAGQYLSGAQTISGDANLVAGNIKSGVSIFGVAGSLVSKNVYHTTFSPTNSGSTSSFVGPATWSISGLSTTPTGFIFILQPYYNNSRPYDSGMYLRNLSPVDGSSGWSANGYCPIIWGTSEDISNENIIHGIYVRNYIDTIMRGEGMNSKLTVTTSTNTITFTLEKRYSNSNPRPAFVRNGPYDLFYW